jgi:enoyl-CoA hydratase/carnithine racemase
MESDGRPSLVSVARSANGVARLTIDHAAKANSLSRLLMAQMIEALGSLAADTGLRALVVTGAGGKAFIGGANVDEMAAVDREGAREFITLVHRTCDAVRRVPVPTIARIEGYTLGAGLEFAAACDIRIASDGSTFAMPEVRLGIPSVVEAVLLPRLIGWGRTRLLLLTGRSIDAQTALSWGLVEEAVEAAQLDATVDRCVAEILESGPQAVRLQKRLIDSWMDSATDAAIAASIGEFAGACAGPERAELMRAHIEKRAAQKKKAPKT